MKKIIPGIFVILFPYLFFILTYLITKNPEY